MAKLRIGDHVVTVDDAFLTLPPEQRDAVVEEIASKLGVGATPAAAAPKAPVDPRFSESAMTGAKFAEGVPVVGAFAPEIGAAVSALAHPLTGVGSPGASIGERYAKNVIQERAASKRVEEESPIGSTAAKVAGGVVSLAPAVMAAPAVFGATGTLPQMVARGAASGAALSAADAAARGSDIGHEALAGGALGAAGGPVGRAIGKGVSAVRGAFQPRGAQPTINVGGVEVPIPPQDPDAASRIEIARRGAASEPERRVVQTFDEARDRALQQADEAITRSMDPTGARVATRPQEAAERVADELTAAEQTRFQTEQAGVARAAAEQAALRRDVAGQAPGDVPLASDPLAAAEAVGTGVQQRAQAARQAFKADYDLSKEMESEFAPGAFRGMAERVRRGLSEGSDPVLLDDVIMRQSAAMLNDIETNVALGNFQNLAAPRVPVAAGGAAPEAAAAAAPKTEAERALDELVSMGVNPARARASVAGLPGGADIPPPPSSAQPRSPMEPGRVAVADGSSIEVAPRVVEARTLRTSADPGYDQRLQPRNRDRAASDRQIDDMSRNLQPERLGMSAEADRGSPIVGPDLQVESGNGRVLAIRKAYEANNDMARRYRDWLRAQGVDVDKYQQPVLVRERVTPMTQAQREAFTVASNQSSTLSLAAAERALADARRVTPESLGLIRNSSDLGAVENRDFVRQFMQTVPAAERASMMTATGDLSSEGLARIRNAVLARAYGDSPVLSRVAEATSDEIKSISNALTSVAPVWARLRAGAARGDVPSALDVTPDLLDAVARTARIRARGQSLADASAQIDAFAPQSARSAAIQRMFYDADGARAASAQDISNRLSMYVDEAGKVQASPGLALGLPDVGADDILATVARRMQVPERLAPSVEAAAAKPPPAAAEAAAGRKIDLAAVDAARKRLVQRYGLAKENNPSDARAARRILHEFDDAVIEIVDSPAYKGDPLALQVLQRARAGAADYFKNFAPQGAGDEVGRAVEKILGRYPGQRAGPDEIAALSYGSASEPGGSKAVRVAQRLRGILGETSPEWGAYKQGLFSYLTETVPGAAQRSASQVADRIDRFLGGKGRDLAQVVFSPEERARLAGHAQQLRASEPVPLSALDSVDKVIARITGRDGGPSATTGEIVERLFGRTGSKGDSVRLAQRLKRDLSPEAWTGVRQGMWARITSAGEGKTAWGLQRLSQNISEFLNESGKSMSQVLYSADERVAMKQLAQALRLNAPVAGATNPSGTAPMLAKIVKRVAHLGGPLLGLMQGGLPGAAGGYAASEIASRLLANRAARQVENLYYGPRASVPVDPRFARAGATLIPGAQQR